VLVVVEAVDGVVALVVEAQEAVVLEEVRGQLVGITVLRTQVVEAVVMRVGHLEMVAQELLYLNT